MSNRKITFVGAGMIGAGLAVNAMMHGERVTLYDMECLGTVKDRVRKILSVYVSNDVCTEVDAEGYFASAVFTHDLELAVKDADLIQESIPDNLELKREMFRKIQEITGDHAIIASSTTKFFPSAMAEGALYPEKIIVAHPYNPAHLLPLIELCAGDVPSEETVETAKAIYESWGKLPILCRKETEGFLVNKFSWQALDFFKEQISNDVCTVEELDRAIMYGPGLRMAVTGQGLTMSLGVSGGFRKMDEKYGKPTSSINLKLADGIDVAMANRSIEQGNDEESISDYRDHLIIEFLRLQKMLK